MSKLNRKVRTVSLESKSENKRSQIKDIKPS